MFMRSYLNQWLTATEHTYVIPDRQGRTNRKIIILASLGIKEELISKITNAKRARRVAQSSLRP
jgi:hypothetical protein